MLTQWYKNQTRRLVLKKYQTKKGQNDKTLQKIQKTVIPLFLVLGGPPNEKEIIQKLK